MLNKGGEYYVIEGDRVEYEPLYWEFTCIHCGWACRGGSMDKEDMQKSHGRYWDYIENKYKDKGWGGGRCLNPKVIKIKVFDD